MQIFEDGYLTQIQHNTDHVDIVDHFDKGPNPVDAHIIHEINGRGNIKSDY